MDPRTNWPAYFEAARGFDVRPTTRFALDKFFAKNKTNLAIDLGCGNGTDTLAILEAGFRVLAIDASSEALTELKDKCPPQLSAHLTLEQQTLEAINLPPCIFLNASFVLPFCAPEAFPALWAAIVEALQSGGHFAGQFFGPTDSWGPLGYVLTHTKEEVEALLAPFDIELLREDIRNGTDAVGTPKHWHVWHVVACKK